SPPPTSWSAWWPSSSAPSDARPPEPATSGQRPQQVLARRRPPRGLRPRSLRSRPIAARLPGGRTVGRRPQPSAFSRFSAVAVHPGGCAPAPCGRAPSPPGSLAVARSAGDLSPAPSAGSPPSPSIPGAAPPLPAVAPHRRPAPWRSHGRPATSAQRLQQVLRRRLGAHLVPGLLDLALLVDEERRADD